MKTVLLLLVILAVAMGPARGLRCHVCSSSANCKQPQTCPASSRYCRTMTTENHTAVVRQPVLCSPAYGLSFFTPSSTQSQLAQVQATRALCTERLHNSAPARTLLSGTTLGLLLALGLLASVAPSL
uniref:Snake toxin/toxin-like domain-containing protein n=1 Tax=Spermophilus dauricus TaxID=99837 RepID=A0A8C9QBY8_SPEDA